MKKREIAFRFGVFILLALVLLIVATEVLKDKRVKLEYDVTAKVKGFYEEPENSLDFIFIGSSQLYADIAPNVLFADFGMTSYDFCANEQPLSVSYYYIKEALKRQNPQAILLDVFTVYGADYEEEGVNHINLDDLPWSLNKVLAIRDSVPKGERGGFYFELAKYHDTWNTLDKDKVISSFYDEKNVYKGYSPFVVRHEYLDEASAEVTEQTEREPLPERALYWLDRIAALCEQEQVDLILIKTPNGSAERQKLYNSVADYALERNVPFLNMNTVFDGEAHINILQAEKVSDYVGAYLAERYTWEDKRENPAFASWTEDGRYFTHKKDKCVQISTDDFSEYFANLHGKEWITLFSLKAEDAVSMSQEQKDALDALGISPDYDRDGNWCYMAILQGTSLVMEPVQVSDSFAQELTLEDGHSYGVSYETDEDGQWKSSLLMDGDNYSLDRTGINLFIYDSLLDEIVEFAAFDGGKDFTIIRAE